MSEPLPLFKTIRLLDQVTLHYGYDKTAEGKVIGYTDGMLVLDVQGPGDLYVLVEYIAGYQVWNA